MIRKITSYEEIVADYRLEINGHNIYLTEEKFRQLAFESISLLDDLLKEKWQEHFEKMKS